MALAQERADRGVAEAPEGHHDADVVVAETVRRYADQALRIARRLTDSPDDAMDVFQFGLLQLVRHKDRVRAATAHAWLFETIRREAAATRERRRRLVPVSDERLGPMLARTGAAISAEERALDLDIAARATEALATLKVDELRALALQASGLSYAEISERLDWTATKTNRALTEGRRRFRASYAALESGQACEGWAPLIAARHEAAPADRARLRLHLRNCSGCRATARELHDVASVLSLVLPAAMGATARPHVPVLSRIGDALGRFGEALSAGVAERGTAVAFKAQALLEAASSAKLAAVAASAVALTGGSVAVREVAAREDRPAVRHAHAAAAAPHAVKTAPPRVPARAAVVRATRPAPARPHASRPARRRRAPEFAASRPASRTGAPTRDFAPPVQRTVSFESAATTAPRTEFAAPAKTGGGGEFGG